LNGRENDRKEALGSFAPPFYREQGGFLSGNPVDTLSSGGDVKPESFAERFHDCFIRFFTL
jgi:hypothetical protein